MSRAWHSLLCGISCTCLACADFSNDCLAPGDVSRAGDSYNSLFWEHGKEGAGIVRRIISKPSSDTYQNIDESGTPWQKEVAHWDSVLVLFVQMFGLMLVLICAALVPGIEKYSFTCGLRGKQAEVAGNADRDKSVRDERHLQWFCAQKPYHSPLFTQSCILALLDIGEYHGIQHSPIALKEMGKQATERCTHSGGGIKGDW